MLALRRTSKAFGGVPKLAEEAELNVNTLDRTLSPKGNLELTHYQIQIGRIVRSRLGADYTSQPLARGESP